MTGVRAIIRRMSFGSAGNTSPVFSLHWSEAPRPCAAQPSLFQQGGENRTGGSRGSSQVLGRSEVSQSLRGHDSATWRYVAGYAIASPAQSSIGLKMFARKRTASGRFGKPICGDSRIDADCLQIFLDGNVLFVPVAIFRTRSVSDCGYAALAKHRRVGPGRMTG